MKESIMITSYGPLKLKWQSLEFWIIGMNAYFTESLHVY